MLVRIEVFVDMPGVDKIDSEFNAMSQISWVLAGSKMKVKSIRLPDSPEPDITGKVTFND